MNFKFPKKKIKLPIAILPAMFEKYELYVGLAGIISAFLLAGLLFYFNVYEDIVVEPEVSIENIRVNEGVLERVLKELDAKSQIPAEQAVTDPFR